MKTPSAIALIAKANTDATLCKKWTIAPLSMPWKWCGVRIANGEEDGQIVTATAVSLAIFFAPIWGKTISAPTEKGEKMVEYIERGALLEKAMNGIVAAIDVLYAPTADVAPVVHGEWIYHECVSSCDGAISGYSCSKCCAFVDEEVFDVDEFHKDFCGNCGAKMDGE
ncbi:hypothetical protein [Anaerotignum sp.]